MRMKDALLSALALLVALPAGAAGAAAGRITYIYPDGRRLMLDNSKDYTLAPGVDSRPLAVAELVRLTLGPNNEVTRVMVERADLGGARRTIPVSWSCVSQGDAHYTPGPCALGSAELSFSQLLNRQ